MRSLIFMLTCALCATAFAVSPDNCVFYAPFDGGFDAAQSRGSGKAAAKGNLRFVPGVRGQGILVGAPETGLSYVTKGNLDLEAGSISIWVKPETWDDTDAAMRFFVGVNEGEKKSPQDGGTFLWLYRYFTRSTYFLVWDSRDQATVAAPDPIAYVDYLKKGEWCHLVGTWNGDELRMYINGVFQSVARVTTPRILRSLGDRFTVGDPNRANVADTVLDELRIFDRALTAPEVAALYKFELNGQPNQLEVTAVRLPGANKVKVDVNALAFRPSEAAALSARLLLQPKDSDKTLAEKTCTFSDSQHLATSLSTAGLPVGQYRVVSTLMQDGKSLATTETPFSLNPPPKWLGSRVGLSDKVLSPWTPVQLRGGRSGIANQKSTIEVSGARSYTVGDALFPSGILTGGRRMLPGPIALSGTVNGATLALTKAKTTWWKKTPARVEFTTSASNGGLTASTESFVEYDGLLWTKLRLQSKSPLNVSKLTLDIPFSKEAATLMHTAFTWQDSGAVRRWSHRVVAFSQIWLGNEDGGVEWTIPSARNWFSADRNRQIEIIP
ncbi:MAG: LamG domain-containing protein, partial [Armatimonadetes bacterium]|nr:LamG domain-containing protein [Armatimonadota bacterium]